jgi:hypothetical protein
MDRKKMMLRTMALGALFGLASPGWAQTVSQGNVYAATVDYASGDRWVLGPYPTWAECDLALQGEITVAAESMDAIVSSWPCSLVSSDSDNGGAIGEPLCIFGTGDDDRDGGDKRKKKACNSTK